MALKRILITGLLLTFMGVDSARADAPPWLHGLVNAPLPAHDEKTDAIILYSEDTVAVLSAEKVKETMRVAYKILRPGGQDHGFVAVSFNPYRKVTSMRLVHPGTGQGLRSQGKGCD